MTAIVYFKSKLESEDWMHIVEIGTRGDTGSKHALHRPKEVS